MSTLSICIFTYNRADCLRRALESISKNIDQLSLDNSRIDVVVSDNCSTDHTASVVKEFSARIPIVYNVNPENLGPDQNLRISTSLAHGEYLWLLSDDDVLLDTAIQELLAFLKSFPDIAHVFYPRILSDANLEHVASDSEPKGVKKTLLFENGRDLFTALNGQMASLIFYVSSTIIKRDLWEVAARKFPADVLGWSHAKPILHAISNKRCAIMGRPGVICRLGNARELNSRIWFDNLVSIYLFAKKIGYSAVLCDSSIRDITYRYAKWLLLDKMKGLRLEDIPSILSQLGCAHLVEQRSFWMWMSYLPVSLLRFGLPFYHLHKAFRRSLTS